MKRVISILLLFVAPAAFATNGYFTHGQGTISKAMAGANTALAQEVLDTETNPAAAAFVEKGYSASLALFSPDRKYTVAGAPSGVATCSESTAGTQCRRINWPIGASPSTRHRSSFSAVVSMCFS